MPLARKGNSVLRQENKLTRHIAGLLGQRTSRPLAGADRPGSPMRRGLLVRFESLDRTRLQTCKRSGWHWQHTRMDDPARAERLWMAIAIATGWLLSVGGEAEAQAQARARADAPVDIKEPSVPGAVRRRRGKRGRIVGIFQHGWSLIIAALLNYQLLPVKPGRP